MTARIVSLSDILDSELMRSEVVTALKAGGIIAFPTDTVYGLGALKPYDSKLYELKGRDSSKACAYYVATMDDALSIGAILPEYFFGFASRFLPGTVTCIFPGKHDEKKIGVRFIAVPEMRTLFYKCGVPFVGTSANVSGAKTARSANDIEKTFGKSVDFIIDAGELSGVASTVLDFSLESVKILRQGQNIEAVVDYFKEKSISWTS